jgi:hypothetical protein
MIEEFAIPKFDTSEDNLILDLPSKYTISI